MPPEDPRSAAQRIAPTFADNVVAWQQSHGRSELPWQNTQDPYRVWLSEVMLQQTTVAAVKSYFTAFTTRWPTVADLAAAEDGEVMAAWAGLGYYARARNLLACARAVAEMGGRFPDSEAELRQLPGLGAYTAAAVAAIAFGRRAVVVDANVERVVARLFAIDTPLPEAKKLMKNMVKQAKANGKKFTCDGCHKDLDNYELSKDAAAEFKKLEAAVKGK